MKIDIKQMGINYNASGIGRCLYPTQGIFFESKRSLRISLDNLAVEPDLTARIEGFYLLMFPTIRFQLQFEESPWC